MLNGLHLILFVLCETEKANIYPLKVVLFTSSNCVSCQATELIFRNISKHYVNESHIEFKTVDCYTQRVCHHSRVRSVPTIRFYHDELNYTTYGIDTLTLDNLVLLISTATHTPQKPIKKTNSDKDSKLTGFKKFIHKIDDLFFILLIVPNDMPDYNPEDITKFNRVSKYFQKEEHLNFYIFYCSDDLEYCQTNRINSPVIRVFYHSIEVSQIELDQKFEELILVINDMLNKYPHMGTEGYFPTVTISNSLKNIHLIQSENLLLLVMSEKCVHCKKFLPKWESFSIDLYKKFASIIVAKINCKNDMQLCAKFNIESVPSLLYINKGIVLETMVGTLDYESIESFVQKHYVEEDEHVDL